MLIKLIPTRGGGVQIDDMDILVSQINEFYDTKKNLLSDNKNTLCRIQYFHINMSVNYRFWLIKKCKQLPSAL